MIYTWTWRCTRKSVQPKRTAKTNSLAPVGTALNDEFRASFSFQIESSQNQLKKRLFWFRFCVRCIADSPGTASLRLTVCLHSKVTRQSDLNFQWFDFFRRDWILKSVCLPLESAFDSEKKKFFVLAMLSLLDNQSDWINFCQSIPINSSDPTNSALKLKP